jgi:Swt1-like HEPN
MCIQESEKGEAMSDFSYQPPPGDKFLVALNKMFEYDKNLPIKSILDNCHSLEITTNGQFSRRRWNEYAAHANFRTDFETMSRVTDKVRDQILEKANSVMPEECGLAITSIDFSPSLDLISEAKTADAIVREISEFADQPDTIIAKLLDKELVDKGKNLSQVYHLLFLVENSLRRFIDLVLRKAFDVDYLDRIALSQDTRSAIRSRKAEEQKHKWIRIRGDSDIFYLDFIDLAFVIKNNWVHFKRFFPDQAWIQVKIDELYRCRCLIAHNSDIGDHEIDVIKTNYKSILLQLAKATDEDTPF